MLGLGEVTQHMARDQILGSGMADADAHPHIVIADMGGERFESVVAGDAAARLDAHLARREIELVMEDDDVAKSELVKAHRLADRTARLVHEGLRLEQEHGLVPELAFGRRGRRSVCAKRGSRVSRRWRRPP